MLERKEGRSNTGLAKELDYWSPWGSVGTSEGCLKKSALGLQLLWLEDPDGMLHHGRNEWVNVWQRSEADQEERAGSHGERTREQAKAGLASQKLLFVKSAQCLQSPNSLPGEKQYPHLKALTPGYTYEWHEFWCGQTRIKPLQITLEREL